MCVTDPLLTMSGLKALTRCSRKLFSKTIIMKEPDYIQLNFPWYFFQSVIGKHIFLWKYLWRMYSYILYLSHMWIIYLTLQQILWLLPPSWISCIHDNFYVQMQYKYKWKYNTTDQYCSYIWQLIRDMGWASTTRTSPFTTN